MEGPWFYFGGKIEGAKESGLKIQTNDRFKYGHRFRRLFSKSTMLNKTQLKRKAQHEFLFL